MIEYAMLMADLVSYPADSVKLTDLDLHRHGLAPSYIADLYGLIEPVKSHPSAADSLRSI